MTALRWLTLGLFVWLAAGCAPARNGPRPPTPADADAPKLRQVEYWSPSRGKWVPMRMKELWGGERVRFDDRPGEWRVVTKPPQTGAQEVREEEGASVYVVPWGQSRW